MSKIFTWKDYIERVLLVVFIALFIRTFLVTGYLVSSEEMAPEFRVNDYVLVSVISYGVQVPLIREKVIKFPAERGDYVVLNTSQLRQLIALEGDKVEVKAGHILINDKELKFTLNPNVDIPPKILAPGKILLLKYNTDISDSLLQFARFDSLRGKVFLIALNSELSNYGLKRFFKPVDSHSGLE